MLALSSPTCTGDTKSGGKMARRRRSTSLNVPPRQVVTYHPRVSVVRPRVRPRIDLRVIEDRRTYHPEKVMRPVATFSRRDQRRIVEKARDVRKYADPRFIAPLNLGFAVPEKVAVCVRRNQRREVIFANRKAGAGSRSTRRRNEQSEISCKR